MTYVADNAHSWDCLMKHFCISATNNATNKTMTSMQKSLKNRFSRNRFRFVKVNKIKTKRASDNIDINSQSLKMMSDKQIWI